MNECLTTPQHETYLVRQDNTIYKLSIKLSFSSKGQGNSKLQKQISNFI